MIDYAELVSCMPKLLHLALPRGVPDHWKLPDLTLTNSRENLSDLEKVPPPPKGPMKVTSIAGGVP